MLPAQKRNGPTSKPGIKIDPTTKTFSFSLTGIMTERSRLPNTRSSMCRSSPTPTGPIPKRTSRERPEWKSSSDFPPSHRKLARHKNLSSRGRPSHGKQKTINGLKKSGKKIRAATATAGSFRILIRMQTAR